MGDDGRAGPPDDDPPRLPGSWRRVALPPGQPRSLWLAEQGAALVAGDRWAAREQAGLARLPEHPGRPEVVAGPEHTLSFPGLTHRAPAPLDTLAAWGALPEAEGEAEVGELLAELACPVRPAKALVGAGLRRSRADRLLATPVTWRTARGPSLGGLHPDWLWVQQDRVVSLRWRDACRDSWPLLDLTAATLHLELPFTALEGPLEPSSAAWAVALLRVALPLAARLETAADAVGAVADFLLPGAADRVQVTIDGPPWLDLRPWLPDGPELPAHRARWLLRELHGRALGGQRLAVHTEPALRPGRRAPTREPRSVRHRRLFSRWDQGIRTDDEGLFSLTPEALAMEMLRGASGVVLDGTCGLGGLAIAAARQPGVTRVIAVDRDRARLALARHNAGVYGVQHKLVFEHTDAVEAARRHPHDLLVLDPPWGGRDYDRDGIGLDGLGLDLAPILQASGAAVRLKLPPSFRVAELPGVWRFRARVDGRGRLKFIEAARA